MQRSLAIVVCAGLSATVIGVLARADDATRQQAVAARGAQVMPFELSATQHIFTKTPTGGIQQVVVRDPGNREQVALIRKHLQEIADHFSGSDFSAPEHIHGRDMSGLAELREAPAGDVVVRYRSLENGAQIEYSTQRPTLVTALHHWFDAQLSDHGKDATDGQHHLHHATTP